MKGWFTKMSVKIAIVDDHSIVRVGLKYALICSPDFDVVGEAASAENIVDFVNQVKPDVLLLDIRMPVKDGVTALKELLTALPKQKVIMLTTSCTEEDIYNCLSHGAMGYVLKDNSPETIIEAIRTVMEGKPYIPPEIRKIYDQRTQKIGLTPREREVMEYLSLGLSNKKIAEFMNISEDGVKMHMKHINDKLGTSDRIEAFSFALRQGIIRID